SDENQSPDGMIFKSFPKEIPTIYMCINALRLIARIFPGHQWGDEIESSSYKTLPTSRAFGSRS
ncbi:MAG: hypothetical protein ACYCOR_16785, partial [Acidobacteriaceae bacterium]